MAKIGSTPKSNIRTDVQGFYYPVITREWALRAILSKYVAISEFAEALAVSSASSSAGFLLFFS